MSRVGLLEASDLEKGRKLAKRRYGAERIVRKLREVERFVSRLDRRPAPTRGQTRQAMG
jgi:hypothetical protein